MTPTRAPEQPSEAKQAAADTAVRPQQRDIQAILQQVRELLHKQEIVESLVARQHVQRQDLVENLVARQHEVGLSRKLRRLHPADIAFVLESLPRDQRLRLWRLVPSELDGAVLIEASDAVREFLIADMDKGEILSAAQDLDRLRLEAHEIQQPEMAALVKPSQQRGTESCVVSGNGHCEA